MSKRFYFYLPCQKRPSTPPSNPFKRLRTMAPNGVTGSRGDADDDNNNEDVLTRSSPFKRESRSNRSTPRSSPKKKPEKKPPSARSSPRKTAEKDDAASDSSTDDSDSDDDDVEALRKRNVEDNLRFLAELGIQRTKDEIKQFAHGTPVAAKRRDVKGVKKTSAAKSPPAPRRVSLRQRKIDSDGLALAPNYVEFSEKDIRRGRASSSIVAAFAAVQRGSDAAAAADEKEGRKIPTTPLAMTDALDNGPEPEPEAEDLAMTTMKAEDEAALRQEMAAKKERKEQRKKEAARGFMDDLFQFVKTAKEPEEEDDDGVKGKSEAKFLKELKKLRCSEALERKVRHGVILDGDDINNDRQYRCY